MEPEIDTIFQQFIERIDRDTLAETAEQVLADKAPHGGSMSVFSNIDGGLVEFTIRKLLMDSAVTCNRSNLDKLARRIFEFYNFPSDWVPPRLLVREALAHTVHRRGVIERLQSDLGKSVDFAPVFERAASNFQRTEDAFLLDDACTDALLAELRQVK